MGERPLQRGLLFGVVLVALSAAADPDPDRVTFIDHSADSPFWFSGQANNIFQYKPPFRALYSGSNSLSPKSEAALSGLLTAFAAYQVFPITEVIVDAEMAYGTGLSTALGLGGFTNLDVVRNPSLGSEPYVARVQLHQIIPLSPDWVTNDERGPLSSFARLPRHRLEVRIGKLSTVDTFDVNPAGSDSRLQFMNWSVDNNGAYDYAADTRGYTYGLIVEYIGPRLSARFGEMLMPTVANGLEIDFDPSRAHAENLELELPYSLRPSWSGTLRVLGFLNHARMGSYRDSIATYVARGLEVPDITDTRGSSRLKYGFGLNWIQELWGWMRAFARLGWNDGRNESFAYTEIDDTVEVGADLDGVLWRRPNDRLGVAVVTNGLSALHREYLRRGGNGFILGDGGLTYARETTIESYYNLHVWRGLSVSADVQGVFNPGFNRDRGPVCVLSLRSHFEF